MEFPILSHTADSASAHSLQESDAGASVGFPHGPPYCFVGLSILLFLFLFKTVFVAWFDAN